PGISIGKAQELLQQTDKLIKTVPEVKSVFGKIGRAETATDPAPLTMIETVVQLKPEAEWRPGVTIDDIKRELNERVQIPGLTNAWVWPISTRIAMLATGIKTPVGVKIAGPDLEVIQHLGQQVEEALAALPETQSVFAERVSSARYIKVTPHRMAMGLVGLSVADVQEIVASAVGGMNITEVVEGRERYPVSLRYTADARDSLEKLKGLPLVTDTQGTQVQLGAVARVEVVDGPDMIRTENARLNGWVYVQVKGGDVGTYVAKAKQAVAERVALPPGYSIAWSGAYEHWERAKERLWLVVPLTLAIILVLLYLNFRSLAEVLIIIATLPLGLVGGFFLMYILGYQLSVAAAIGFIALGGVAVEIGVVMILYLDRALAQRREARGAAGLTRADVREAVVEGALLRLRPVTMTKLAILAALLPIMFGGGAGSEAMQRIAAPLLGGVVSVAILTLAVIPAAYLLWRSRGLRP
ncbi:MAG TPA: efflux RND transporter permease subunit, partial [Chromatiaceae bacterium]|nr:efflux RND transporter permease subunit [Chromatiaceae bacterium]